MQDLLPSIARRIASRAREERLQREIHVIDGDAEHRRDPTRACAKCRMGEEREQRAIVSAEQCGARCHAAARALDDAELAPWNGAPASAASPY